MGATSVLFASSTGSRGPCALGSVHADKNVSHGAKNDGAARSREAGPARKVRRKLREAERTQRAWGLACNRWRYDDYYEYSDSRADGERNHRSGGGQWWHYGAWLALWLACRWHDDQCEVSPRILPRHLPVRAAEVSLSFASERPLRRSFSVDALRRSLCRLAAA